MAVIIADQPLSPADIDEALAHVAETLRKGSYRDQLLDIADSLLDARLELIPCHG